MLPLFNLSLRHSAFFCAALVYSSIFIYLTEAQQQVEFVESVDDTPNLNFIFDFNDLAGAAISDISANAFLQQRNDLIAAAAGAATPQPTLFMRANMNSGLRRK